jgi:hypothetical protein
LAELLVVSRSTAIRLAHRVAPGLPTPVM